jgi:hypothetical protein
VVALLEQIKISEKTIVRLEEELHEALDGQEAHHERNEELVGQLEVKDNEIMRLTDAMTGLAEAVGPGCYR